MEISTNELGIIKTKSLNNSFTEELNKNFNKIEENLDFFYEKGLINKENKEIFKIELNKGFGSKRMINKETIGFAAINNLTTSPKNAEKIIGPGEIEEYPLSKGLYMYKNKTLLFLLEDSEDYKKLMGFLVLCYEFDRYNSKQIHRTNNNEIFKNKSEGHVREIMEGLNYNVKEFQYFNIMSRMKILNYLVEKIKEVK